MLDKKDKKMLRIATFAIIAFFILIIPAYPTDGDAVSMAQDAAKNWLALTDTGKYGESLDAASKSFKKAITKADWVKTWNRPDLHSAH